jgi:hypothetical protein
MRSTSRIDLILLFAAAFLVISMILPRHSSLAIDNLLELVVKAFETVLSSIHGIFRFLFRSA